MNAKKIHWQSLTDENESLTDQYHVTRSKKSQHEQQWRENPQVKFAGLAGSVHTEIFLIM